MPIEEKLLAKLKSVYDKLNSEGKLLSKSQLVGYFDTFRKMFGPDRLKSLDGELLLETMHDHSSENRDSLVYWLEFKDDEELPGVFGSIAGGSALKFGIYRRKDTRAWMTGSPMKQVELSIEEAVEYARKHRDQFIKGAELLEKLPINGTDADYRVIQEDMDRLAPDVSNTAWGHKYFSMLFPEKLDNYHAPGYQRFHLMKLMEVPPEGAGRYTIAGRYVAIANELGISMNNLTRILSYRNGRPHSYWRIGTSDGSKARNRWDLMKDGNCIAIGWPALGDLSGYEHNQEGRDAIRALMTQKYYPDSPSTAGRKAMEVFRFAVVIPDGSLVLTSDGAKVLGIGKVSGPYRYEPKMDFPHRRLVEWLSLEEWSQPKPEGLQTTVFEIRDALNIVEAEKKLLYRETVDVVIKPDVSKLGGLPARIHSVLVRKGQVIVYGPPGTGKTYWAEISACELAARSHFGLPYAQLNDEQKEALLGGAVRMCTFHPAYGYEDFLEGYRAETSGEQMVFVLRDGIFKKLCQDAWNEPGKKFYLIIDEINRGDIPRIFGELLTILEKNKRGKKVLLPLSGRFFQVPDNVYIIGTMNTADRSIALLDTALRRRFGFIELMPDSSVLDNRVIEGIPLGPWLDALNQRICEHVGRDARNLQVGHSFFLEGGRVISDFAKLARVIQEDIVPLLEEYCYEDYDSLEKILGRKLIDMQNQKVRHELFDPSRQDELIVALVAPSHEISTSSQAVTSEEQISDDGEEENGGKNATDQE